MYTITQNKKAPYWSVMLSENPSTLRIAEIKNHIEEFTEMFELYNIKNIKIDVVKAITEVK